MPPEKLEDFGCLQTDAVRKEERSNVKRSDMQIWAMALMIADDGYGGDD
jgi:hypothetical protein